MKDEFEISLLESGELMKRGVKALAENVGKIIAVITIMVSALVLFTDIGFTDFGTESFTSTLAVMLLASYLMYFSMSDAGEKRGEDSEEYKNAYKKYEELVSQVGGESIAELRHFCKSYSEEELRYRRDCLLTYLGYTREEYEKYKSGEECSRKARKALKRAGRLKAIPLTPKTLLSKEKSREKSELTNPEASKLPIMLTKLIPTTLCMLVTVSVMFTAKDGMTAGKIIEGIFKLSSLPVIGFKGYSAGYNYTRRTLPLWIETKARLLDAFIKSKELKR